MSHQEIIVKMNKLTKKEKKLMIKWFKEALDDVTEDERFTMRRTLRGS